MSAATSLTFTFDWARNALFLRRGLSPARAKARDQGKPALRCCRPKSSCDARLVDALRNAPKKSPSPIPATCATPWRSMRSNAARRIPMRASVRLPEPHTPADALLFEPYAASSAGTGSTRWLGSLHTAKVGRLAGSAALVRRNPRRPGCWPIPAFAAPCGASRSPTLDENRSLRAARQEQGPPAESLNTEFTMPVRLSFGPGN